VNRAALVSGGLDSAVMLAELAVADPIFPLYVRAGLLWEAAELHWLRLLLEAAPYLECHPLTILDFPVADLYGVHWSMTGSDVPGFDTAPDSNYLPGRNLLLLSKAAVFCAIRHIERIAMAPLGDNPFPDGRPEFFRSFEEAVRVAMTFDLTIETPFRALGKGDVVRRGRGLPLELTFSCLKPDGIEHCGDCTKCAERQHGFRDAGVADPTRYSHARQYL
jgi:7-cyano-7-deazaguanine synthase